MRILLPRITAPASESNSPRSIRRSDVLPPPLGPTIPIRACSFTSRLTSENISTSPKSSFSFCAESIGNYGQSNMTVSL